MSRHSKDKPNRFVFKFLFSNYSIRVTNGKIIKSISEYKMQKYLSIVKIFIEAEISFIFLEYSKLRL